MMKIKQLLLRAFSIAVLLNISFSVSAQSAACDENCLKDLARQYMAEVIKENPSIDAARDYYNDVVQRDFSALPWGEQVRFTENNVAIMIGEGFWGAARGEQKELFIVADESTGNVLWYGITEEHEQAAYHGYRLKIVDRKITEVESYLGREGQPDLFAPTDSYTFDAIFSETLPASQQRDRNRMTIIANGYLESKQQNNSSTLVNFTDDCARVTNGVNVTHGKYWAADIAEGCRQQLEEGIYKPVDRIRARRFPIVNVDTGVIVALSIEDHAARFINYESTSGKQLKVDVEYPNSRAMLEIFKIVDGKIKKIEGVSVFSPYYIQSLWEE